MSETNAFVTGSQAYGVPKESSDIDLVVLMSEEDMLMLADANGYEHDEEYPTTSASLRFGKLNLICVTDPKDFKAWQDGTNQLKDRPPVPREAAVSLIKGLLAFNQQTHGEDFEGVQDLDTMDYESMRRLMN